MSFKKWDEMLEGFIMNLAGGLLRIIVLISAIGIL